MVKSVKVLILQKVKFE